MPHLLPELPYAYDALEPHIDARTMQIHHGKHHQGYVNNLNAALDGHPDLAARPLPELLDDLHSIPVEIHTAVRNNGGGHANHSLFWSIMSPSGGGAPSGALGDQLNAAFGSFEAFKEGFAKHAATRVGRGWAWLVRKSDGSIDMYSTANQDSPWMVGDTPILGLDVWEHAYYLNYQNRRPDYVAAFWNLVNWDQVGQNFDQAG
jgi:Fe-Mn family superoxide dismutase